MTRSFPKYKGRKPRSSCFGCRGASSGSAASASKEASQLSTTSFKGRSTAKARGDFSSRASRTQSSRITGSMFESALLTPTRSQNSTMAWGGTPLRRIADSVGMRGSSHPSTVCVFTSFMSLRLDMRVYWTFSLENSICRGASHFGAAPVKPPASLPAEVQTTHSGSRSSGSAATVQSYKGRWSSNSSVQSECVMPSRASDAACAKSYIG
mmetsp:Transcript_27276/g.91682  ORF Transcript_27276/g.91682 Transcript_27276/m.91682 type:complete len:210 (-) Transcript_27276:812-1441(-)